MTYQVKEIFYTLQGEGAQAGRAAVFLRFAGCNLWSGREEGRSSGRGSCSEWCDTDFIGGKKYESPIDLAHAVAEKWPTRPGPARRFVVCTGGEPLLQLDESLCFELHSAGFEVAVETNGTRPRPNGIDWLTVSPKSGSPLSIARGDELKFVYPQEGAAPSDYAALDFRYFFLQAKALPFDVTGNIRRATERLAADYCLEHPQWRLSTQLHNNLGIR